jgi:hypothetical protein
VYKIFTAQTLRYRISAAGWVSIAAAFMLVVIANGIALFLPMKIGIERLKQREV